MTHDNGLYFVCMELISPGNPLTVNSYILSIPSGHPEEDEIPERFDDFEQIVDFFALHGRGRVWWNTSFNLYTEVHV